MTSREPIEPRLPADANYWESLAQRIEDGAGPHMPAGRTALVWWARRGVSPALAASTLALVASAWWWMPSPADTATTTEAVVSLALQPGDPLADELLHGTSPPEITTLLAAVRPDQED